MSAFSVTLNQLKTSRDTLSDQNAQFKSMVEQLEETAATMEGMWEGAAKSQFATAFNEDTTQMGNFYNAINLFISALDEILTNYSNTENANYELAKNRTYGG